MAQIRMKHDDPRASLSIAKTEPDDLGGVMIEDTDIEQARAHGWYIRYAEEEPELKKVAPTPSSKSKAKPKIEDDSSES